MRTIAFIVVQLAVIAGCIWLEYLPDPSSNRPSNPGLGIFVGMFMAAIVTAGIVRLMDAKRFGWKASAPPKISRVDRIEGTIALLNWLIWIPTIGIGIPGLLNIRGDLSDIGIGIAMFAFAASLPIMMYLFAKWLRSFVRRSDGDANGAVIGPVTLQPEITQTGDQTGRSGAGGRGFEQLPEPLRRLR